MNTPGQGHDNWSWRAVTGDFTFGRSEGLRRLADLTGRLEKPEKKAEPDEGPGIRGEETEGDRRLE
jgi:hypothetical protein